MKKILPFVFNNNEISNSLLQHSIFNKIIDINILDTGKITEFILGLDNGLYIYCDKMIIFTDIRELKFIFYHMVKINKIGDLSKRLLLCLIDKTEQEITQFINKINSSDNNDTTNQIDYTFIRQYTDIIKSFVSVDDMIMDMKINGYNFHTNRDISRLNKIKYNYINLTILLNNVNIESIKNKSINDFIVHINNQLNLINPVKNDFLVGNVQFAILISEKLSDDTLSEIKAYINTIKLLSNYSMVTKSITIQSLSDMDIADINMMYIALKNRQNSYLEKNTCYMKTLFNLYKYQLDISSNNIDSNYILIYNFCEHPKQTFDIYYKINLSNEFNNAIKSQTEQYIAICNDANSLFILGTKKIILFYMLLYQYYGFYKPWENLRKLQSYYKYDKSQYLNYNIQMTEHLMHFTDVLLSTIEKITIPDIIPTKTSQSIVIIGINIPKSFLISQYDDIHTIYQIYDDNENKLYEAYTKIQNIVCICFWNYIPSDNFLNKFDVKKIYINYRSYLDIYNVSKVNDYEIAKLLNTNKMIVIEDKTTDFIFDRDIIDVDILDSLNIIKMIPLYHEYIDSRIGAKYYEKEDILTDIIVLVSDISNSEYKSIVDIINKSDIYMTNSIDVINYISITDSLVNSIKRSKFIVTDNPIICLIAMCYRTAVIFYSNNKNNIYFNLEKTEKNIIRQIKVVIMQGIDMMLDEAYYFAHNHTWNNFFINNIIAQI